MKTKNTIALLLASSVLGLGSAVAQNTAYSDFDANGDGQVDASEFNDVYGNGLYNTFNANGDGYIEQNEFSGGVYKLFDANSDGALSENEYNTGIDTLYDGDYSGSYGDLDADGNGTVNQQEFVGGYDPASLYTTFDANGNAQIDETEFADGVFGLADANNDGILGEDEYNDDTLFFGSSTDTAGGGVTRSRDASFDPETYGVFGDVGIGAYEPYETGVDADGGAMSLAFSTPNEQNVDFNITGPNGYREDIEVGYFGFETGGDAQVVEGLLPGVYSVAATDDNLQLIETKVEVREGELVALNFNMQRAESFNYDLADYQPYGNVEVGPYEDVDTANYGVLNIVIVLGDQDAAPEALPELNVTGPDDFRREFEDFETELGSLLEGPYSVAATAEGYKVAEGKVDAQAGQRTQITLTLEPLD